MRDRGRGPRAARALLLAGGVILGVGCARDIGQDRTTPIESAGPGAPVAGKAAAPSTPARAKATYSGQGLVVHEWGTFTSIEGSDGASLEWRPLVQSDLPRFVYALDQPEVYQQSTQALQLGSKSQISSRQRMETPVTYFYTDHPEEVEVSVRFPQGLLTEWYPRVRELAPLPSGGIPKVENGQLTWGKIKLFPAKDAADLLKNLPKGEEANHYYHARETDSAVVRVCNADRSGSVEHAEYEKFLFYRGVGNFTIPLSGKVSTGAVDLENQGPQAFSEVYVVDVEGSEVTFAKVGDLAGGAKSHVARPLSDPKAKAEAIDELADQVAQSLMSTGLYEKEAWAMVNTWRDSWFETDGLRVLYLLPQARTDQILPLSVSPAPKEEIRVMVGRLELITPKEELDMATRLLGLDAQSPEIRARAARDILSRYGRFAEPLLSRVAAEATNATVRGRAKLLLDEMKKSDPAAGDTGLDGLTPVDAPQP